MTSALMKEKERGGGGNKQTFPTQSCLSFSIDSSDLQ